MDRFEERVYQASQLIADADHVLIGAGAGLSAAAGLQYDGEEFRREFKPWIEQYGITDLYTSSFYPFPTQEEKWAYWARHIWFSRYRTGGLPLYRAIHELVKDKDYFVITTNTDAQFQKSGFDANRLFYTQGDYGYLQDATGEDQTLYYNEELVKKMLTATRDCRIPPQLIPSDPVNGHDMAVNLRCDDTFVEDDHWHEMQRRYADFVSNAKDGKLVLLEFGVGFNTPVIIRFPFEQMASTFPQASLIRFNRDYPQLLQAQPREFISFREDLTPALIAKLKEKNPTDASEGLRII